MKKDLDSKSILLLAAVLKVYDYIIKESYIFLEKTSLLYQ